MWRVGVDCMLDFIADISEALPRARCDARPRDPRQPMTPAQANQVDPVLFYPRNWASGGRWHRKAAAFFLLLPAWYWKPRGNLSLGVKWPYITVNPHRCENLGTPGARAFTLAGVHISEVLTECESDKWGREIVFTLDVHISGVFTLRGFTVI